MIKQYLVLSFIFFSYILGFSQDSTVLKNNNVIKFTPFKLIELSNPAVEVLFERRLNNHLSLQAMASYILPESVADKDKAIPPDNKGYRLALEGRFYFTKPTLKGMYLGLELNYLKINYKALVNFDPYNSDPSDLQDDYGDTIRIAKKTFSINPKIGIQIRKKRFSLDIYGGVGLRYKDVKHLDKIYPDATMSNTRHPNIENIKNTEGKYFTVSIPLNVSVGYSF